MEHATWRYLVNQQLGVVAASSALALALGGCASKPTPQLVDARSAYARAEESSAAKRRPADMERAKVALDRAEDAHDADPGSRREARLAERAEHRANLAVARSEGPLESEADVTARDNAVRANMQGEDSEADARIERERIADQRVQEARARERAQDERVRDRVGDDKVARAEPAPVNAERAARPKAMTDDERKASASLQSLSSVANVKEEPRGVVITMSGSLLFPNGQKDLSPVANKSLDQVAHALANQPSSTKFEVSGYTDDTGSAKQNQQLSTQRAQAVADYMVNAGIERSRIEVIGRGEASPIAGNDTPEGRASNRRVEIVALR